ncbi:hypothetical protein [Pseudomonas sp. NPDC089734]|uniref:hypothetical protein n=1 Tax=Pseudomonas sp. NPDC089734 TaxID=3364469 RepID=UPI0038106736
MASIISDVAQSFHEQRFMGYGGVEIYNKYKDELEFFFTPEKISAIKYFFLSCVFRQVIAEERPINKVFMRGLKRYLLGKNPGFGIQLILKVNSGESHPMATSIALLSSGTHAHGLILVPEFLMHLIIDEQQPVLAEDRITVVPEDFEHDADVNRLCRINAEDYRIAPKFQAYLDSLK